MLLVRTYLAKSLIHGIGLFTGETIAAGVIVYKPSPDLDLCISHEVFSVLDERNQKVIAHYGFRSKVDDKWYLAFDDIRFCNHSTVGNIGVKIFNGISCLAAKNDIVVGEELLQDYGEFENSTTLLRGIG